jgi:hypothetical protein
VFALVLLRQEIISEGYGVGEEEREERIGEVRMLKESKVLSIVLSFSLLHDFFLVCSCVPPARDSKRGMTWWERGRDERRGEDL